jgi:hypothetical protein
MPIDQPPQMIQYEPCPGNSGEIKFAEIKIAKPIWQFDMFGDGRTFVGNLTYEVSWFQRFRTWLFLGSKWRRL